MSKHDFSSILDASAKQAKVKIGSGASRGVYGDAVLFKVEQSDYDAISKSADAFEVKGVVVSGGPKENIGKTFTIRISGEPQKVIDNLEQGEKRGKVTTDQILVEGVTFGDDGIANGKWAHKAGGSQRKIVEGLSGPQHISFMEPDQSGKMKRVSIYGENPSAEDKARIAAAFGRMNTARSSKNEKTISAAAIRISREVFFPDEARGVDLNEVVENIISMSEKFDGLNLRLVNTQNEVLSRKFPIYSVGAAEEGKKEKIATKLFQDVLADFQRTKENGGLGLGEKFAEFIEEYKAGDLRVDLTPSRYFNMPLNLGDASKSATDKEIGRIIGVEKVSYTENQMIYRDKVNPVSKAGEVMKVVPMTLIVTPYMNKQNKLVDNSFIKFVQSSGEPTPLDEIDTRAIQGVKASNKEVVRHEDDDAHLNAASEEEAHAPAFVDDEDDLGDIMDQQDDEEGRASPSL